MAAILEPAVVYLGLGSNVGRREDHIRSALEQLGRVPGVQVLAVSQLRETEPVGGPPQAKFLNGAAKLTTSLPPFALLAVCQQIERAAGRDMTAPPLSPRPLDLDLLWYGGQKFDTRELRIPHPRMHQRSFVLEPLAELGFDVAALAAPALAVIVEATELGAQCTQWLHGRCTIGLVPTMGALHAGHASLLQTARQECDRVLATIFVNPLQFGPHEDFTRYPRPVDADLEILRQQGVDAVFMPRVEAMYPTGFCTRLAVGEAAADMEGAVRPGHFSGVATVVAKLLAVARPTVAYFGRKDAQQVAVVRRMIEDLEFPVALRECQIVREPDGLAMSSRNAYLSQVERRTAPVLYRALRAAQQRFRAGERRPATLRQVALDVLATEPSVQLDYLELRREGDLQPLLEGNVHDGRLLVAARLGKTRLLDNLALADLEA